MPDGPGEALSHSQSHGGRKQLRKIVGIRYEDESEAEDKGKGKDERSNLLTEASSLSPNRKDSSITGQSLMLFSLRSLLADDPDLSRIHQDLSRGPYSELARQAEAAKDLSTLHELHLLNQDIHNFQDGGILNKDSFDKRQEAITAMISKYPQFRKDCWFPLIQAMGRTRKESDRRHDFHRRLTAAWESYSSERVEEEIDAESKDPLTQLEMVLKLLSDGDDDFKQALRYNTRKTLSDKKPDSEVDPKELGVESSAGRESREVSGTASDQGDDDDSL